MKRSYLTAIRFIISAIAVLAVLESFSSQGQAVDHRKKGSDHSSTTGDSDCSLCHVPQSWRIIRIIGKDLGKGKFQHSRTGFNLIGKHRRINCMACHKEEKRISRACRSCHNDAHGGAFYKECDVCHSEGVWNRAKAMERHRQTRLPLTGKHALADCTECHRQTEGQRWRNVPTDCYACHKDDFNRTGIHPRHKGALSRNCAQCHRPTGWSPAVVVPASFTREANSIAPSNHDLKFPISHGVHRTATCDNCHLSSSNRRAIRCIGCHAHNPIRLRRQHRNVSAGVERQSCRGCHPGGVVR
ncbi:MAG: hypothetical protein GY847_30165 [Proteobacteria bacterium]|nr:hypothetical protein [Pseudomonadota bacterium]